MIICRTREHVVVFCSYPSNDTMAGGGVGKCVVAFVSAARFLPKQFSLWGRRTTTKGWLTRHSDFFYVSISSMLCPSLHARGWRAQINDWAIAQFCKTYFALRSQWKTCFLHLREVYAIQSAAADEPGKSWSIDIATIMCRWALHPLRWILTRTQTCTLLHPSSISNVPTLAWSF